MSRLAVLFASIAFAAPAGAETLRVLALDSAPFFYEKNGRMAGIEYDILDYFAKSRNATLEVEFASSFASILERVEKGEADVAGGTITITPERARRVSFSAPYFPVQVVLVERMGDDTHSVRDLVGHKVAAFAGTTAEDALKAVPGIEIVNEGPLEEQMRAIERGDLRAAAADSSAIIPELENFPGLKIGMALGEESGFGFALPKDSPLTASLSETVRKLKQSGIYFRIVTAHMGPRASEIVRGAKLE
ncbi:MAG: transporter substrate-binding domain-containing protein [Vicinamibacteria bacterium]